MKIENIDQTQNQEVVQPNEELNEKKESFDNLVIKLKSEIEQNVVDFEKEDERNEKIIISTGFNKSSTEEVKKELKIDETLKDLNTEAEQLKNDFEFQLGLSEDDFHSIEKRFGVKITNEDIQQNPKSFFEKMSNLIKNKISGQTKYSTAEIESLIDITRHEKQSNRIFYEGQEDDVEKAKTKWIDDMVDGKDIFGCQYGKLSNYLEKISLLKTTNGYHEYARLLKESLGDKDFRIDYIKGAPSGYGGTKWINMNPLTFTAKKESSDYTERLFYHYAKIEGNELSFVRTLLHEGTHAVLLNKINNPKTPEETEARDALYSIYCYVVSKAPEYNSEKFYGLTNLDEFCAEYYAIGSIRELLKKIETHSSQENFVQKNDYTEKMAQPEIRQYVEKAKRLFVKQIPSKDIYSVKDLTKQIEENVRKLIGVSFEYQLKDESIDSMVINYAAQALAKKNTEKVIAS